MTNHTSIVVETRSPAVAGPNAGRPEVGLFRPCGRFAPARPAAEVLATWSDDILENGDVNWPDANRARRNHSGHRRPADRRRHADEIALVPNTTVGLNLVAEGLDWATGDNVVTLADEFPSNVYPWMNLASRGVETRRVPTEVSGRVDFEPAGRGLRRTDADRHGELGRICDRLSARRRRIAKIAHERGALFVVDAHSRARRVSDRCRIRSRRFLAADGHKWLLGPEGAGIAYIRREHLDRLRPIGLGWHSVVHERDYTRIELNLQTDGRPLRRRLPEHERHARPRGQPETVAGIRQPMRRRVRARHYRSGLPSADRNRRPRSSPIVAPTTATASSARESSPSNCPAATRWPQKNTA